MVYAHKDLNLELFLQGIYVQRCILSVKLCKIYRKYL